LNGTDILQPVDVDAEIAGARGARKTSAARGR
jgi:hypothetical protein